MPQEASPKLAARQRQHATVRVDGVDLYYEDRGAGSPVLLVHGAGGNADTWGSALEDLARDHRVIAYDRRGFSRSVYPPTSDYHRDADDASALLDALDAAPATVVGWSVGGVIALDLAIRHPHSVAALVLEEPPLYAKRKPSVDVARNLLKTLLLRRRGRDVEATRHFVRWNLSYSTGGSSFDRWPQAWRAATDSDAAAIMRAIDAGTGERTITPGQIRALSCPVVGLVGERSLPYLRSCFRRLERLLPHMDVRLVTDSCHAIHLDDPPAFAAAVRAAARAAADRSSRGADRRRTPGRAGHDRDAARTGEDH